MKKIILLLLFLTIFFVTTNAQYTKLFDFTGATNGSSPQRPAFISDGNYLYGTTQFGGINDLGTIFKIKPDGTGYVKLLDFAGASNGKWPHCSLVSDGTFMYGMTSDGGTSDIGVIFKIKPDGTSFSKILDFSGPNGGLCEGALIYDGTYLYGMALTFGALSNGCLFKIKPDGTGYVDLYDCFSDGVNPYGSFISVGTYLYGMTQSGGSGSCNCGTIFKIMPNGTGYANLLSFNGSANGADPTGSLISDGTYLYGMTPIGGTNGMGVIFKIKPDGTGYTKLLDFAGASNGSQPTGSLIADATYLYGVTSQGGISDSGTVFKIKFNGTGYTKLVDFTGVTNGSYPYGSLFSSGTFLYGMTALGGVNGKGTIFKLGITTGITENNLENGFNVSPNPFTEQTTLAFNEEQKNCAIKIIDVLGKEIKTINFNGKQFIIEKGEMQKGIYFVEVIDENKNMATKKIIIQ